jgi:hypothetical protein
MSDGTTLLNTYKEAERKKQSDMRYDCWFYDVGTL